MKRLWLFLLLSSMAFGQGVILPTQQVLKTVNGVTSPVANATITVCAANASGIPCTPVLPSAIFKDAALTQPLTNPFTSDANGNYVFAIAPGNYTVTVTAATFVGYSYQTTAPMAAGGNNTFTGNNTFSGANTFGAVTVNGSLSSINLSSGNVANKPVAGSSGDPIRYVTNNGNDSNDCLSWGSACLTIAHACATIANQDVTCLLPFGAGTVNVSDNFNGSYPAGFLTGQAAALKIIGPGYLQGDSSVVSARGSVGSYQDAAFMFLIDGGQQNFIQAGPRGKECFPLTAVSITSNVLTVTCTNTFAATEVARISGTAEAFLNGQSFTVASATGTQWTANFTHANFSNSTEPGGALAQELWLRGASTLNLPDLAVGTSTPASGFILADTGATEAAAIGHCPFFNGPTANSGGSGVMNDSGFGCNQNLSFPNSTHGVLWTNGGNQIFMFPYIAPTGTFNQQLMNQSGMVALNAVGDTVYGTYRVTADQTITAGASLTNIPGLSWTMPANQALNVGFSCHLLYSQATAAASDSFGIQDVTVAPSNLMAKSQAYISASTFTAGNLPTLTTTTATSIVTFTPSAATTVWNADIDGLIEQPSNASTSAINIMAQFTTNNGTIKRGSFCTVF